MDAVSAVDQMDSSERVLGICINGEHHAYSLNLLCRHEVVTFKLIPETGSIFSWVVDGRTLTFRESGVNTFSTILILSQEIEVTCPAMVGQVISRPMAGKTLHRMPCR